MAWRIAARARARYLPLLCCAFRAGLGDVLAMRKGPTYTTYEEEEEALLT